MSSRISKIPEMILNDGGSIPCVGMGTFGSDRCLPSDVAKAVDGALRAGYRMFDCASCYGNEPEIGDVFSAAFDEGVVRREELFVMTKVWNDMHRNVEASCRKSITDLKCDYIDMFFIHWPFPNYHAPGCSGDTRNPDSKPFSVEEFVDTYRQCEALVEKGLIRRIGVSNMTIPKFEAVMKRLEIKPAACESEFHPCFAQRELLSYLIFHDILPVAYMPIGSPMRPDRDIDPSDIVDMEQPEIVEIAKKYGVHPAIIAIKWAIQRGSVPIPFSLIEFEYVSNLEAAVSAPLTEHEMKTIDMLDKGNRLARGQVFLWPGASDWHDLWDEDGKITDCIDCGM